MEFDNDMVVQFYISFEDLKVVIMKGFVWKQSVKLKYYMIMCFRRFLFMFGFLVVLCCVVFGGYYLFFKVIIDGGYMEWFVWSNCLKDCGEGF